ncbi:MAG: GGDEF domain-containing protein [Chloracidobacterium sp.]|nr:GGDEF domain-containing protein [Chloracidobacterium sp.]
MAKAIMKGLHQEIERILSKFSSATNNEDRTPRDKEIDKIFRENAAIRLEAHDALYRYAAQMSKDELIEFQSLLSAKLDDLLSVRVIRLVDERALAWAEQSECDAVTALPNRAAFNRRLRGEIERARRYRRELSVVLFDIDRFKSVNDRFGHPAGDRMLAEVANLLKSSLRRSDSVFRYGGDEFAAICPETSGEAMACALRRVESIKSVESIHTGSLVESLDISWGVASFPTDAAEEDELIRIADVRLYACKRSHRPKIETVR